ncbi:MAG: bifunctional phosphopantothenoylcysteine decarboxylase/phosphopantothenate--cysteine ligase CoaBC [Bdellovibrionales bacterium]
MSKSKIAFFITGSIAAFKAAQVVSRLAQEGHEVQAVMTDSACKFLGPATLEGLTGRPVQTDLWKSGQIMDHIHLSRWADFGVICPASAHTVGQMAFGLAPDLVSATLLAWPKNKKLYVYPAMNVEMMNSAAVQQNLKTLKDRGILVRPTGHGTLACGETGAGRMLEPEEILADLFSEKPRRGWVLVTGGGTRESIDGIRFLANVSTGQTSRELCEKFDELGWEVTYAHAPGAPLPRGVRKEWTFTDTESLLNGLRQELSSHVYNMVVHAAAVSDYTIASVNEQAPSNLLKLDSREGLRLTLKPTPKLLPLLREFSTSKDVRVVGFKLTLNESESEARAKAGLLLRGQVDAVVCNDWTEVEKDRSRHPGRLIFQNGHEQGFANTHDLATQLDRWFQQKGKSHDSMS